MGVDRAERIELAAGVGLESLPLTPTDAFVLSRIVGASVVGDVVAASGLGDTEGRRVIERLLELGAIRRAGAVEHGAGPRPRSTNPGAAPGTLADRQRQWLRAQLAQAAANAHGSRASDGAGAARSAQARDRALERGAAAPLEPKAGVHERDELPARASRPMVPATDIRLDQALDLPFELQRELLHLHDHLDTIGHFDLLGIDPTGDVKLIRRAYREASRRLHPDSYYGKSIGAFRPILDDLFIRAKAVVDELYQDDFRASYVHSLVAAREAEARARDERAALERRREDERRARAEAEERERRAARDEDRRRRQQAAFDPARRVKQQLKDRAREHKDAGLREVEAGNHARAANHFRMAIELDETDEALHGLWQHSLAIARRERAEKAYKRARELDELGHAQEAMRLYVEAAEANPTPTHAAAAGLALADEDGARAHSFAMKALDGLAMAASMAQALPPKAELDVRMAVARTFLAMQQAASAAAQVKLALALAPDDPQVRALSKTLKIA